MIKTLTVENFTVIGKKEKLEFSKGLNIVLGENGVGKSHLLKLAYTLASVSKAAAKEEPNKEMFQKMIAKKLLNVFRPDSLGRLVNRTQGSKKCTIEIQFHTRAYNFSFSFSTRSKTDVTINKMPERFLTESSIFIPTREMLSIYPGFAAIYREREVGFDETYYDLVQALDATPLRGPRLTKLKPLLEKFENIMGGNIHVENGRFYLQMPGRGKMEIQLVAEGIRKIAMLAYLIINGAIYDKSILFWDEPETNLNPKLIRYAAEALMVLAKNGIQIYIASHSLFLLRELEILSFKKEYKGINQRYFAFGVDTEDNVTITQGSSSDEIDPIVSLDENLMQSDRYLDEDFDMNATEA